MLANLSAQTPIQIKYECTPEDIDLFGLNCTEDQPCPVFLELSSAETATGRLLIAGNLHTRDITLYSLLLASDDNGVTWTEPQARIRNAALEQIEFFDPQTGWVTGGSIDPLTRNPFLLLTADGGRTWRQVLLADDSKFGTIAQFHFTSQKSGQLILDTSQGRTVSHELYESQTGGESWEMKQKSSTRLKLNETRAPAAFRVRVDAKSNTFRLERRAGTAWDLIASFAVRAGNCPSPMPIPSPTASPTPAPANNQ